jgi:hypothetical protein
MIIVVSEVFSTSKHGRYFRFPLDPNNGKFDYRARVSYNCFFRKRNHKKNKTIYYAQSSESYNISKDSYNKIGEKHGLKMEHEFIDLNSIWEFYKEIGYDYKKQKWL